MDIILKNLLCDCKVLNINTKRKRKVPKETNWKQKFRKYQNENICLTYLNTESLCKPSVEPSLLELYRGAAKFRQKANER